MRDDLARPAVRARQTGSRDGIRRPWRRGAAAALVASVCLSGAPRTAAQVPAQAPPNTAPPSSPSVQPAPEGTVELVDVFDLLRKLRHKEPTQADAAQGQAAGSMSAFMPVIGYKATSGVMIGAAGNVATYYGDPADTQLSAAVASFTFSSKKQTSLSLKFGRFSSGNRWMLNGDNRFQWTSQDTFGLGTDASTSDRINVSFDYFRVYETAFRQLWPGIFGGIGVHYGVHRDVGPGKDAVEAWDTSPYVSYSRRYGFPLESQTSAGTSVNLLADTRDSTINAGRGWLASASYRTFFDGFLGGDSTWQELYLDLRTYRRVSASGRHTVAFWVWGDLVTGGVAPYLDLPATGMDTYGRSGRGYIEGRYRGEQLVYGEVEYRGTLMRNGLLGMVAFVNTTTLKDAGSGEQLFDRFATGAGLGLRVLINKRSKTNLCLDLGFGRQGSRTFYLAVQEAF